MEELLNTTKFIEDYIIGSSKSLHLKRGYGTSTIKSGSGNRT